ncbi:unnamed protein product [Blepharisma stoltei]|uniref:STIL N-terminal domain-containing protein n=1 Tax=Blepharisma stoltei TaxID=1481888 RepID=A0AAU9JFU9_9CILI|nr:unnamed protein product [Blepharisma stoltei]
MQDSLIYWEKPIISSFQFTSLWECSKSELCMEISFDESLPTFQIAGDVLEEICHRNKNCVLKSFKSKENKFCIEEVSWEPSNNGDYSVPLQTSNITPTQIERSCDWALHKADSAIDLISRLPEAFDYIITLASYTIKEKIEFSWSWIYPKASFQFKILPSFKIISNPLSKQLTHKSSEKFRTGLLTMDSLGRVIALLGTDPMVQQYPCVGIWVSGLNENKRSSKLSLWSACFHYTQSKKIKRLSSSQEKLSFMMVIFNKKVSFYEVNLDESATWNLHSVSIETTNLNKPLLVSASLLNNPQLNSPSNGLRTARFGESPSLDCSISDILSQSQSDVSYFGPQSESFSRDQEIKKLQDQITNLTNLITNLPNVLMKTPSKCTIGTNTTFEVAKESPISPHSESTQCYSDYSSPEESSFRSKSFWDSPNSSIPKIMYNSRENTFEGI